MPIQDLTNISANLKILYEGNVRDILNRTTLLLHILERRAPIVAGGESVDWPVLVSGNPSTGFRSESATLPNPGRQTTTRLKVPFRYLYAIGGFTGPSLRRAMTDRDAFISTIGLEMSRVIKDMRHDFNFYCWDDSTGVRSVVRTGGAGLTSVNVLWAGASDAEQGEPGTRYLLEGMDVLIGTDAELSGGTPAATTIQSIVGGDTFTCSPAVTIDANDLIVEGTAVGASSYNNAISGVLNAIDNDTGTYMNISRATYPRWRGNVLQATSLRNLTLDLLQRGIDLIHQRSGAEPDTIICHHSIRRVLIDNYLADRRYLEPKFDGGFAYLSFMGGGDELRIYVDKDCPYNRVFILDKDSFVFIVNKDFHFISEDGLVLRAGANDSYTFRVHWSGNLVNEAPNQNCVIEMLRVPSIDSPIQET